LFSSFAVKVQVPDEYVTTGLNIPDITHIISTIGSYTEPLESRKDPHTLSSLFQHKNNPRLDHTSGACCTKMTFAAEWPFKDRSLGHRYPITDYRVKAVNIAT
jgi:hypothetical protein